MKKLILLLMAAGIALAFYAQSTSPKNVWLTVIGLVLFMGGMMWLSSKTPSKNQSNDDDEV
ncbi:hypothetical protein [Flavobacterium caeni]|uniref:PEP-CTERM protein-sorting domain-containing protein n=1 Tax=Flavobacterium caeni TaxID=490189 RepID=A0A1G5IT59_9FLAO|nr:hypothetical protein [Flavobacterium caeni]SCY79262.1 hypothetical protein SAMN02927903_02380 [Flavobacterium caeni]